MIDFLNLEKINAAYNVDFKREFSEFLNKGTYIQGNYVSCFESEYASYCGTKHCVGVSNGLDALRLIFEAYKILNILKNGDEIIVPANTYIATVLSITHCKLKPVLVEPNINTYNIDVDKIEKAITSKTKAILGVHLYGQLYNVTKLEQLCETNNLLLVEDAAQAHGAIYADGRKAGNISDAAAFSFYPTKNLGALGDAGAITTNNSQLKEVLLKLRNYGRQTTYKNEYKGFNCRLDEIQAAFLSCKLKDLDKNNEKRQQIAKKYKDQIKNDAIILPKSDDTKKHIFHLFVVRTKNREILKDYLYSEGIMTSIHYPIPIHKQQAFKEWDLNSYPITEKIHNEVLSIPLNTALTDSEVNYIIKKLSSFNKN